MAGYEESYAKRKRKGLHPQVAIIGALVAAAIFIAGGFVMHNKYGPPPPVGPGFGGACCDTGDGPNCQPQKGPGQTITFKSPTSDTYPQYKGVPVQYDLLSSNKQIYECFKHGVDSGQTVTYPATATYPGVHPIIYNTSQELGGGSNECAQKGVDQIASFKGGKHCVGIPDDELVYVCVKNCAPPYGTTQNDNSCDPGSPAYANSSTVYDIYIRDADYPSPGVPDPIANCKDASPQDQSVCPTNAQNPQWAMGTPVFWPEHKTLQLHTFYPGVSYVPCQAIMPRPFCKPAVYFYPPQKEQVHIAIAPKGNITYTNPAYPANGWDIIASPNGSLEYQKQPYEYLYYEAAIPDAVFPQVNTNTGFVVAYTELRTFFDNTLPELGLNEKEKNDFKDYWMKALPESPYYFISLVPREVIQNISPLKISPVPETLLRITLNFQPLDKKISVTPPAISQIQRKGFTVVEWGGTFKQDKNHSFTCLQ